MDFYFNAVNFDDFWQKLNEIGFLHKDTANVHEFEVLQSFGHGYIRHYCYLNGLHISLISMTLHKDLTYSFNVNKYFEIGCILSGHLDIFDEDRQQLERINTGECFKFITRKCKGWNILPKNEKLNFVVINIEKEYIHALAAKGIDIAASIHSTCAPPVVHSPIKLSVNIELLLNKFFICPYEDEGIKKMFFEAIALEILSEYLFQSDIRGNMPKLPVSLNNDDVERLYMAKQVITERMAAPPSLEELSKLVCLNTFKLKIGFKTLFSHTVYGYLRHARMEKAKLLLTNTPLCIHHIALQLGYYSGSNLSAIFKKYYGLTPKQYRKRQLIHK